MGFVEDLAGSNTDVVHLLSGLAFVLLGVSILLLPKDGSPYRLARILWLLAAFGIFHGIDEWLELWTMHKGEHALLNFAGSLILVVSLGFLVEFGRRLVRAGAMDEPGSPWLRAVSTPWLHVLLGLGLWSVAVTDPVDGIVIGARVFLAVPGSLLTALGFVVCVRRQRLRLDPAGPAFRFLVTAVAFLAFGAVDGLVVEPGIAVMPGTLDETVFLSYVGLPVQLFRGLGAIVVLLSVSGILRVLHDDVRRRLSRDLQEAECSLIEVGQLSARNRLLLEAAGQGICGLDRRGCVTFVNPIAAQLLGWGVEDLVGKPLHAVVHHTRCDGRSYPDSSCPIQGALVNGNVCHTDNDLFWCKDGTCVPVDCICTPVMQRGEIVGAVVSFRDVSARQKAEKYLQQAALVLDNMPEGVMITDGRGRVQTVNPALLQKTGYRRGDLLGRTPRSLRSSHQPAFFYKGMWTALREDGRWQGEVWIRRKDGEIYPEWVSVNCLQDDAGRNTNYIAIFSDITTHRDVRRRLRHLAYYDVLTELPNRQLFKDRLDQALAHARRKGELVAVLFLDLDRFKHINDTLGHSFGDRLLKAVADRLKATVRESDTIARIGGDEFTAILPDLETPDDAAAVARKILDRFSKPIALDGHELYVTASIGIAIHPADGLDQESLMRKADTAMYRAKETGRNNHKFYRDDLGARFEERLALENDLRRALDRDELYLLYQPQVEIETGRLVGVEALARWRHPTLGDISPNTFIPIAEETGLISRIGEWSLRTACRESRVWLPRAGDAFRIAVNLSGHQLRQRDFADAVLRILAEFDVPSSRLTLELTESVLMDNFAVHGTTLNDLANTGVQIALDDFGTGYSSLSYIKRFSIDKLKIDQSFVRDLPFDANDRSMATMIIAMAHASNIRVTAEGVERQDQLEFLREQGCDEMQGFLYSEPVSPAEIGLLLDAEPYSGRGDAATRRSSGQAARGPRPSVDHG